MDKEKMSFDTHMPNGCMRKTVSNEKLKSILPLNEWYNWADEFERWKLHIKIKYFFISLKHRLTKK